MKKVLVPVDFSNNSNSAIRYAISFAKEVKCQLILFHSSTDRIASRSTADKSAVSENIKEKTGLLMSRFLQACEDVNLPPDTIEVKYSVRHGGPVTSQIIETVREEGVDLIIMTTHGATGLKKIFMGSETTKIIEVSPVPVLAIPMGYDYHQIKKVVYSSDLRDYDHELSQVRSFAGMLNADIEVLSFNRPAPVTQHERQQLGIERITFTERTIDERPLIHHLKLYLGGKPGLVLTMFTHSRSRLGKLLFGSKTEDIAMDLHFPLLTFHKRDIS